MKGFCYLDNNAGAALAPGVLDTMLPYLKQQQGNPSSSHRFGRLAKTAIENARQQVADLVNVSPSQIIFTSGGTESNNQVFSGLAQQYKTGKVLLSAVEHPSVIEPASALSKAGFVVQELKVDAAGVVEIKNLLDAINKETRLVSVMWANNETGVIQDITALTAVSNEKQVLFHCDAVQAIGKLPVDFTAAGVQLMSLSAHKFGGPKGIGALIVKEGLNWPALIYGGGQEANLRSGTENVPAIVGLGTASVVAGESLKHYQKYCRSLRDLLEARLLEMEGVTIFAQQAKRLANTVFFSLAGFDAETLLMTLDKQNFSVSSGSACGTGQQTPSYVLTAMGVNDLTALGAIRVSISQQTTVEEIERLAIILKKEASRFQNLMNR